MANKEKKNGRSILNKLFLPSMDHCCLGPFPCPTLL